jgi:hypothetical protein
MNQFCYELGVTTIALGATPIQIIPGEYVNRVRINANPSMVIVNSNIGVSLAQGVPVVTAMDIVGPARFYVAGAGSVQIIFGKSANDSIYGS